MHFFFANFRTQEKPSEEDTKEFLNKIYNRGKRIKKENVRIKEIIE